MKPTANTARMSRRTLLRAGASGFGFLAFADLAHRAAAADAGRQSTHFVPRARRVIFLCMNGGPSHVDLFDHKPTLTQRHGQTLSQGGGPRLMRSPFEFRQHGESGLWCSSALPRISECMDELCVIHSMHTDLPNHSQAFTQMHTGSFQFERPSLGAWTLYGLGSENSRLPGFITLSPPSDNGGARNYGSSFLPVSCQGTRIGTNQIPRFYAKLMGVDKEPGPPLRNISSPKLSRQQQLEQVGLIQDLNRMHQARGGDAREIEGAIRSFELAVQMQDEIPEVLDLTGETQSTLRAYGIGSGQPTDRFGRQCLLARRMAEAGVRFIELTSPIGWDHHFRLQEELSEACTATDQPVAALLTDLRQRGMLDDTLVIWAGEFGRTPYAQSFSGRDHNNHGYTIWMAGGGVRGGHRYGATDDFGWKAVEDLVHIHDWNATILHLLGLDHQRLTFRHAGREYRLTDVYGNVVDGILA